MDIWQRGDSEGQKRMLACLSSIHKESYFRRVVYKNRAIDDSLLQEMAENVFLKTWETFNDNGLRGKLHFDKPEYTAYLFIAFKGNYLKSLEKELRRVQAEREFGGSQPQSSEEMTDDRKGDGFSGRTQNALNQMSPDCRQLLIWKHIEGLSHDEIARRKEINRSSSIKMLSRCGRRFSEVWQKTKH